MSDHEEAKRRLAALQAKAKVLGAFIHLVANVLTGDATRYSYDGQTIRVEPFHSSSGGAGAWPSMEELVSLLSQIDTAKNDIAELEWRRKDLGV